MPTPEHSSPISVGSLLANTPKEQQLETQLLIAHALNCNRANVLAYPETTVDSKTVPTLLHSLQRLRDGEPYAYIVGSREFYGLEFSVNPNVLIPRPDTELLVELAVEHCPQNARVVDLGTGSGAIAVSLKHARPDLQITATDLSAGALQVAKENAAKHGCEIKFVESHWYADLQGTYDTILSNPPYIKPDDPHLPALSHEPQSALVARHNGMADIQTITAGAANALTPEGVLLIEHGYDQEVAVRIGFQRHGFDRIKTHKDLAQIPRAAMGRLGAIEQ